MGIGTTGKGGGRTAVALVLTTALLTSCASLPETVADAVDSATTQARCSGLAAAALMDAPVDGLTVTSSTWIAAGTPVGAGPQAMTDLPGHCVVEGFYGTHEGVIGGPYRTGFRMRLPEDWNGRFLFQGGGGSNGVVGDATGTNGAGNAPALQRGYAVIAQDSGHDNDTNTLASHQGQLVFGFDPQSRRDYGHSSLKPTNDLAHHLMRAFYGRDSGTDLFWGCSKGGQEGMAFAQRYPEAFDGIVAIAPGMSLPRAALAEAWDVQAFAGVLEKRGEQPTLAGLQSLFSPAQSANIQSAIMSACDGLDGAEDGMISQAGACTTARVEPALRQRQCTAESPADGCLQGDQIDAMVTVMGGPRSSSGEQLYAPWAWDAGVAAPGWNVWKVGLQGGPPALNVLLGGGSLSAVFTTPPTPLGSNPDDFLKWQMGLDFDRDAQKIYAVAPPFTTSAWQDVGMRSPDLSAFRAAGGKMIVPHGTSDPVFSVLDTIAWWQEVDGANAGRAADFARVFPVPGMNHCAGGPATDRFDSLSALEDWVLNDRAPDRIMASAGAETPFPGREVPLCAWPKVAIADPGSEPRSYRCAMPPKALPL